MARRKHISWKTKYAAALRARGEIPHAHAKEMTEDQIISLYQVDHNILYETGHPDRDRFWNLFPMLIAHHRKKSGADQKIIAKGRRIRAKHSGDPSCLERSFSEEREPQGSGRGHPNAAARTPKLRIGPGEAPVSAYGVLAAPPRPSRSPEDKAFDDWARMKRRNARRIQSRGFDRRLKRKLSGKVVPR